MYEGRACLMFGGSSKSNIKSGGDCRHNDQYTVGTNCHILDINGRAVTKCFRDCEQAVSSVSNASMDKCEIMENNSSDDSIILRNKQDSIILMSSFPLSEEQIKNTYWMIDYDGTLVV